MTPAISDAFRVAHETARGKYYVGDATALLRGRLAQRLRGKVNLILTSPPFPLNKKKSYGNLRGEAYRRWFADLAPVFADILAPDGSVVVELGNAWVAGRPAQSLLHLEALLAFVQHPKAGLRLCQQFVCHNPARLPSPAQWVTIKRIRVVDSFTHVWWMAKSDYPKADNRRVLRPYSTSMRDLLRRGAYNAGRRPSQHRVSRDGFLADHGGSIMPNVVDLEPPSDAQEPRLPRSMLRISNTMSFDAFQRRCRAEGIEPHPARMPPALAAFFIDFLTEPGDLVLDPFAGSNTTGFAAEMAGRHWVSVDIEAKFAVQSKLRFESPAAEGTMSARRGVAR